MTDTARTLNCPACGAALEPPSGASTMKCGYCGTPVIIPPDLRTAPPANSGNTPPMQFDFGQLMAKAIRMGEVVRLAKAGDRTAAIKLYQENSGVSSEQAEKVVDSLISGKAVEMDAETRAAAMSQIAEIREAAQEARSTAAPTRRTRRSSCSGFLAFVIVVAAVILVIMKSPGPANTYLNNLISQFNPSSFSKQSLLFGQQGSGAGMFDDPRSIAVAPDGTIFVADYSDGRLQSFDPTGNFISLISIGGKNYISSLSADRNGKLYAVYGGEIWIYDAQTGRSQGDLAYSQPHYFESMVIGADGNLYAVSNGENILRFNSDGKLTLSIPAAISSVSGNSELDTRIAVDGLGNIYALGTFNYAVFEYSSEGKYLNRFGAQGDGSGKFTAPEAIAVDGYNRNLCQ